MGGGNKATLQVGDRRIVDRQLTLLRQVADPVFIVSGRSDDFAGLDLDVVPDLIPNAGALGGIYSAVMQSPQERTVVVACDMPFLALPLLRELTRATVADVVLPRSRRGLEPLCACWSRACAVPLRRRIAAGLLTAADAMDDLRVEEIGPERLASCDPHDLLFVNVNTPQEYERAVELSRQNVKP